MMPNAAISLIFPPRAIPALRDERGQAWRDLVDSVEGSAADSHERVAFVIMMARLCTCATCTVHSYRAVQGCVICASQAIQRFRGSDDELVGIFAAAQAEVKEYLAKEIYPKSGKTS